MFKSIKNSVRAIVGKIKNTFMMTEINLETKAHDVLDGTVAEAYVDTGVKILIAVVIGALLLGLLYTLFNTTIMPKVTEKITGLFNYAG